MKNYYAISLSLLLTPFFSYSQWIDFTDQTAQRIVVTNINDNVDPSLMDDQEKDLASADFNKDGFTDLVSVRKVPFSSPGAKTDLLFMNRNGVLTDETDIYIPEFLSDNTDARDVIVVDVDGDTWEDLFIVSTFDDQPKLFINQGEDGNGAWLGFVDESSTRLPEVTVGIIQFCAGWSGDLTGNNAPDLYMVNYDDSNTALDILFVNDGTGNFTEETQARMGNLRNSSFGTGVEFHDVDNDNDLDIVKNLGLNPVPPFNAQGTIALFNNGDGTFTNWHKFPGSDTYMFTAGDLNDDGMLDYYEVDDFQDYVNFTTGMQPDTSLSFNQDFLTSDRTDVWGGNVKMIDLDGDGDLDVSIASVDTDEPPCDSANNQGQGGSRVFVLFENEGLHSGNLVDPYIDDDQHWHMSNYDQEFIDINNDGNMDMILATCEGYQIFMQEPVLSVADNALLDVGVFPNPSNGTVNIQVDARQTTFVTVEVFSLEGKRIETLTHDPVLSNVLVTPLRKTTALGSGMYFLQVSTDLGTITKKVVIR